MVLCIPDMVEEVGTARLFPFGLSRPALGTSVDCSKTLPRAREPIRNAAIGLVGQTDH
jgi:hypothetical protein